MAGLLGIADSSDRTSFNMQLVLCGLIVAALACVLGAIPIATARRRGLRQVEGIAAIMIVWGLATAGSVMYSVAAEMKFEREYEMRVMQNFDPGDQGGRPKMPWLWWTTAAAAWGGAMIYSTTARTASRRGFDVTGPQESP